MHTDVESQHMHLCGVQCRLAWLRFKGVSARRSPGPRLCAAATSSSVGTGPCSRTPCLTVTVSVTSTLLVVEKVCGGPFLAAGGSLAPAAAEYASLSAKSCCWPFTMDDVCRANNPLGDACRELSNGASALHRASLLKNMAGSLWMGAGNDTL